MNSESTNKEQNSKSSVRPITKDFFVKVAFHTKIHKMLDYGTQYTPNEQKAHEQEVNKEIEDRFEAIIQNTIEKIERKELEKPSKELSRIKKEVLELKKEFLDL